MDHQSATILITGGTSGVGHHTALRYAREGASVTITGRDETRGEAVVKEIDSLGGRGRFVRADLTVRTDVLELTDQVPQADILINNAGYWALKATADLEEAEYDTMFAVNVKAPFLLTAIYGPQMAARGRGAIVNVSTMVAQRGAPIMAAYGASKAAIEAATRAWATEYSPSGVRVNAVALGPILTPAAEALADMIPPMVAAIPLRRAADPDEVAETIAFLTSDASSYISGAVIPVDGGRVPAL